MRREFLTWLARHGRTIAGVPPEFMPPPVRLPRAAPGDCPPGVNVLGYLRAEDGLGAVARSLIDVLQRAKTPMSFRTCSATNSRQAVAVDDGIDDLVTYDTTIACVNADQFPLLDQQLREVPPVAATTVGIWAWEVDVFPEWMARSAALVDEVWVYSRHAADAIEAACPVPVHVFAPPVVVPESLGRIDREAAGITDDFTFLFCFDFASIFERKNPLAVINAFRRAFAPGDGRAPARQDGQPRHLAARLGAPGSGDRRPPRHRGARRVRDTRTAAGADGRVRLLRVAAPRRGLRAHDGRGDGGGAARDRHRVLGEPRVHDARDVGADPVRARARAVRMWSVPADRALGRARRRRRRRGDARDGLRSRPRPRCSARAPARTSSAGTPRPSRVDFVRTRLHDLRSSR